MIVFRAVFEIKAGRSGAAMGFSKWLRDQVGDLGDYRIHYNMLGEGHRIAWEKEFEDLAASDRWWADLGAAYAKLEVPQEFADWIESWKCREIWRVIE
jgi:hypothetical protein